MTYSAFKKLAACGNVYLELVERYGCPASDNPEWMQGLRKIKKVGCGGFVLENQAGELSGLKIDSAKLFECEDNILTVYNAKERPQTEQEREVVSQ